jgi:hypothetical protein
LRESEEKIRDQESWIIHENPNESWKIAGRQEFLKRHQLEMYNAFKKLGLHQARLSCYSFSNKFTCYMGKGK